MSGGNPDPDRRRAKRSSMPFSGIARVGVLISDDRGVVIPISNLFLWDVSATGGSVLTSLQLPLRPGARIKVDFFDDLSPFNYTVAATIVWVRKDAFGFKMHFPSQEFLEWVHGRLPRDNSQPPGLPF